MTLAYLCLAWAMGLIIASLVTPATAIVVAGGIVGVLSATLPGPQVRRRCGWLLLSLVAGVLRYQVACHRPSADDLAYYNDRGTVQIIGYISAEPDIRGQYSQLEMTGEALLLDDVRHTVQGRALLNVSHYPVYRYGDRVQVTGLIETPPVLDDFDYREYLASKGVQSLLRRPQITRLSGVSGSPLLRWMYRQKTALREVIERILPGAEAGLLSGILLGLSHTLSDDLYNAYRGAGLTHIIVISGFNIALVAQAVMLVSRRLARRWIVLLVSLCLIALYTIFVGPTAPVVRATLMIGIALLGQILGRKSHALTSLALASGIMTAANPLMLWSVSFQLSFAATLALVLIEPRLSQAVGALLEARGPRAAAWLPFLRDTLLATMAAQLVTMPVIWYHFGELSIVALLTNVLVLPVQPAILILGAAATMLGAIWLPMGRLAAWLVWPFLRWTNLVVETMGALPWASVTLPPISAAWLWGGIACLALIYRIVRHGVRWPKVAAQSSTMIAFGLPALATLLVWAAVLRAPDGRLHIHMLDIGQGDAILIRTPSGRNILVDGGPDPVLLAAQLGRALPFWQRRLDLVVATHADRDHLAGLMAVATKYAVGQVLQAPQMSDNALCEAWHQALAENGIVCQAAQYGQTVLVEDGVWLGVLHPDALDHGLDDNQGSVVLHLQYGAFGMLLTGDMDQTTEASLLARGLVGPATALKVAHHGAASSTSAAWLDAVDPQWALISVGADNDFGHPSPDTLQRLVERGTQILRTDQQGPLELVTDGQQLWIKTDRHFEGAHNP